MKRIPLSLGALVALLAFGDVAHSDDPAEKLAKGGVQRAAEEAGKKMETAASKWGPLLKKGGLVVARLGGRALPVVGAGLTIWDAYKFGREVYREYHKD